jgi:hypothetical protein
MKKKISIRTSIIKTNKKNKANDPVIIIESEEGVQHANHVVINGPSSVVYDPVNPLPSGAVVWVETDSDLEIS